MKNDSKNPISKLPKADTQTGPFEPILDEKLTRFLERLDSEMAQTPRLDVAQ